MILHSICAQKSNLVWPNPFLVQGSNRLQYESLAMSPAMVVYATYLCDVLNFIAGPQLHVAYVIAVPTTFMLNFRIHCYLFYALSLPADLSVAARTIHNTHGGYNFSVRSCNKCLLLSGALESNYLILDKYCAQATFTIATHNRTFTAAQN